MEETHRAGLFNLQVSVDIFKSEFKRIIDDEEVFIGYPQLKKLEGDGIDMLTRYGGQIENGQIKENPMDVEAEFSIPFAGTSLIGKIDRLELDPDDGEYVVWDHKTGKKAPDEFDLRNNLQFTSYYWAAFILKGKYPKKLIWHHMRTGEMLETQRTPQDIINLQSMIKNAVAMQQQGMRHRIFHESVCGYCDYKPLVCTDYELEEKLLNG